MWVRVPPRVLSFLLQAGQVPEMSLQEQAIDRRSASALPAVLWLLTC